MKDEIKRKIKGYVYNEDDEKKILDYITNLQTIEQQYSSLLSENAELENKITNLQEENERLYEELKLQKGTTRLFKNDLLNVMGNFMGTELDTFEQQEKELQDYKTRNEKAIEYIKEHIKYEHDGYNFHSYHLYDFSKDDLLNLLQGKSDE